MAFAASEPLAANAMIDCAHVLCRLRIADSGA
jgi:hypothetical protein